MLAHRAIGCLLFELFLGLWYRPASTALFPTPPHVLLDDIEYMQTLVPFCHSALPTPTSLPPLAFSSYYS
jgi:hypothetical protein